MWFRRIRQKLCRHRSVTQDIFDDGLVLDGDILVHHIRLAWVCDRCGADRPEPSLEVE